MLWDLLCFFILAFFLCECSQSITNFDKPWKIYGKEFTTGKTKERICGPSKDYENDFMNSFEWAYNHGLQGNQAKVCTPTHFLFNAVFVIGTVATSDIKKSTALNPAWHPLTDSSGKFSVQSIQLIEYNDLTDVGAYKELIMGNYVQHSKGEVTLSGSDFSAIEKIMNLPNVGILASVLWLNETLPLLDGRESWGMNKYLDREERMSVSGSTGNLGAFIPTTGDSIKIKNAGFSDLGITNSVSVEYQVTPGFKTFPPVSMPVPTIMFSGSGRKWNPATDTLKKRGNNPRSIISKTFQPLQVLKVSGGFVYASILNYDKPPNPFQQTQGISEITEERAHGILYP